MKRSAWASLVLITAVGSGHAYAGFWENVFQGLDYVATPTGGPLTSLSDGTRINGARSGRVRIVPNGVFGQGYRLEFDRTFGADSRGRRETFRFGWGAEMTLSGSTQFTAGYNNGPGHVMGGFADLTINNLNYDLRTKSGAQDVELSGTLNVAGAMDINTLGFYDLTLNISNTQSSLFVDGVAVRSDQPTNFDVGPIVIKGNLFWDLGLALLGSLGVDTTGLHNVFPSSPIDQINRVLAGRSVAGENVLSDFAPLLLQTVLGRDDGAASTLVAGLTDSSLHGGDHPEAQPAGTLPEPGALLLTVVGASSLWYFRRK